MCSNRFATSTQFSYELHVLSYMDRLYLHPIFIYWSLALRIRLYST
nr:MAG TPA: hypothetical protein [Caudoviricetes sp.]